MNIEVFNGKDLHDQEEFGLSIGVFCGSAPGKNKKYLQCAKEFGLALVEKNITLVYGGTSVGLMREIADTVLDNGGKVIGIIPKVLTGKEVPHEGLSKLYLVDTMHERKALMEKCSSGFVALPGGAGTMDELFDIFTLAIIGHHAKPIGILNANNYYGSLISFFDHMVAEGFLGLPSREGLFVSGQSQVLIKQMFKD